MLDDRYTVALDIPFRQTHTLKRKLETTKQRRINPILQIPSTDIHLFREFSALK
jgi:hypothetical protein